MDPRSFVLPLLVGLLAFLYSAAGQTGNTGYVAVLVVAVLPAEDLRATALMLHTALAAIGTVEFA